MLKSTQDMKNILCKNDIASKNGLEIQFKWN